MYYGLELDSYHNGIMVMPLQKKDVNDNRVKFD